MWDSLYTPKVVITVTDDYSHSMRKELVGIASKACFPAPLELVPEYEAAALAAVTEIVGNYGPMKAGDCFMICNTAFSIVDVVSYKITRVLPLAMKVCAPRICKLFHHRRYFRMRITCPSYHFLAKFYTNFSLYLI